VIQAVRTATHPCHPYELEMCYQQPDDWEFRCVKEEEKNLWEDDLSPFGLCFKNESTRETLTIEHHVISDEERKACATKLPRDKWNGSDRAVIFRQWHENSGDD
jgi:hypothetical protein